MGFWPQEERRVFMKDKITWSDILSDFKKKYPRLSRRIVSYRPYGYMTIVVYLADGEKVIYNQFDKKACFISA